MKKAFRVAGLLVTAALVLIANPGLPFAGEGKPLIRPEGRSFVALSVRNIDNVSAWYRKVFGLSVASQITIPDGRGRIELLRGAGLWLELLQWTDAVDPVAELDRVTRPFQVLGPFKTGLFVADIGATHAALSRAGIETGQILDDEALNARFFQVRDPEGNIIQVFMAHPAEETASP